MAADPNGAAVFVTTLPTVLLLALAGVTALIGRVRPGLPASFHRWLSSIALVGAGAAAVITLDGLTHTRGLGLAAYAGAVVADRMGVFAVLLLCATGLVAVLTSGAAAHRLGPRLPAFHALVLTATAGGTVIAVQWEMGMLVVGLGLLVISLVGLVALEKTAEAPGEVALRALAGGGVALALLLYGLAILYGATGSTDLAATAGLLVHAGPLEGLGLALTVLGLAYLVGAPRFTAGCSRSRRPATARSPGPSSASPPRPAASPWSGSWSAASAPACAPGWSWPPSSEWLRASTRRCSAWRPEASAA